MNMLLPLSFARTACPNCHTSEQHCWQRQTWSHCNMVDAQSLTSETGIEGNSLAGLEIGLHAGILRSRAIQHGVWLASLTANSTSRCPRCRCTACHSKHAAAARTCGACCPPDCPPRDKPPKPARRSTVPLLLMLPAQDQYSCHGRIAAADWGHVRVHASRGVEAFGVSGG